MKNFAFGLLIGSLFAVSLSAFAFDFDTHFDKSVLPPFKDLKSTVNLDVKLPEFKDNVNVISLGFNYVSTASDGNVSVLKFLDDDSKNVCYVFGSALQCLKNN